MSYMGTSGELDSSLSLFMRETCAPVSSNKSGGGLLLTTNLIVHLPPTNSTTALVSFTVKAVEYVPELIIFTFCYSCSWDIDAQSFW